MMRPLLIALGLLIALPAYGQAAPRFQDGQAQVVPEFEDSEAWIRERWTAFTWRWCVLSRPRPKA